MIEHIQQGAFGLRNPSGIGAILLVLILVSSLHFGLCKSSDWVKNVEVEIRIFITILELQGVGLIYIVGESPTTLFQHWDHVTVA